MIVSVHALFSHNDMIGSKIIAKGTKHLEPDFPETSHTALLINERWVHEATGKGVSVKSYDFWSQQHEEVARVRMKDRDYQEIADQFRQIQDKKYDYFGVFFIGFCIIPTFFGAPLAKKNLWQSDDKYFCCEVLGYLTNKDYSMSCPNQILRELQNGEIKQNKK